MSDIQTITEQAARDARDVFESYGGKAREAIDYMEQLIYAAMRKTEPATDAAQSRAPFFFDRYINGVRMAEDVCIERETTLEGAMQAATRIAAKGPNGEAPVLVYRAPAADARAERDALRAKVARLEGALGYYADQYCEGFCQDLPPGYTDENCERDCGGCKARAALTDGAADA